MRNVRYNKKVLEITAVIAIAVLCVVSVIKNAKGAKAQLPVPITMQGVVCAEEGNMVALLNSIHNKTDVSVLSDLESRGVCIALPQPIKGFIVAHGERKDGWMVIGLAPLADHKPNLWALLKVKPDSYI